MNANPRLASALAEVERGATTPCAWKQDDDGNWETGCKHMFIFIDDGPKENHFEFCPYCGKKIKNERSADELEKEAALRWNKRVNYENKITLEENK